MPKGALYHQIDAVLYTRQWEMICKGQEIDDMPILADASVWIKNSLKRVRFRLFLVERDGFEPSKSVTTDLQSAPFGHSGISPYGAGDRNRTNNLLITNQLLCQLSYTSRSWCLGAESNHRHRDFQSLALPTELSGQKKWRPGSGSNRRPLA